MVMASALTLNAVRYTGYCCLTLTVHWVTEPTTAMRSACFGRRRRSAIRYAACDTDSVEPLASGIGRLIFQIEVRHADTSRTANSSGRGKAEGKNAMSAVAPPTMTATT